MKVGDIITKRQQRKWQECQICGHPASFRITFLVGGNPRGNPASSAYGRDNCSWCSDAEAYACKKHEKTVKADPPSGISWCATFPLKRYKHMGFYLATLSEEIK